MIPARPAPPLTSGESNLRAGRRGAAGTFPEAALYREPHWRWLARQPRCLFCGGLATELNSHPLETLDERCHWGCGGAIPPGAKDWP